MTADQPITYAVHGTAECFDCRRLTTFEQGRRDPDHECNAADRYAAAALRNAYADGWQGAAKWVAESQEVLSAALDAWHAAVHSEESNEAGLRRVLRAVSRELAR